MCFLAGMYGRPVEARPRHVQQILKDQVTSAKRRMDLASEEYDTVMMAVPSPLQYRSGILRIQEVCRTYKLAREDLTSAITRLNDFLIDGTVPDDLK